MVDFSVVGNSDGPIVTTAVWPLTDHSFIVALATPTLVIVTLFGPTTAQDPPQLEPIITQTITLSGAQIHSISLSSESLAILFCCQQLKKLTLIPITELMTQNGGQTFTNHISDATIDLHILPSSYTQVLITESRQILLNKGDEQIYRLTSEGVEKWVEITDRI